MADGGAYIIAPVIQFIQLAIFAGIKERPITGNGWTCYIPWAKSPEKEMSVAQEMEESAPYGPGRITGTVLLD